MNMDEQNQAIDEIARRLHELEQNERHIKEQLLYLQADIENLRKRSERETAELRRTGNTALLRELIPVSRMLDRTICVAQQEQDEGMAIGLEMISRQLSAVFEKFGMRIPENAGPENR